MGTFSELFQRCSQNEAKIQEKQKFAQKMYIMSQIQSIHSIRISLNTGSRISTLE